MSDPVIQLVATAIEGENVLVVLTKAGKLYARVRDQRNFAQAPNHLPKYDWKEIAGPSLEAG